MTIPMLKRLPILPVLLPLLVLVGCDTGATLDGDSGQVTELVPLGLGHSWILQRTGWIRTDHQNESFSWVESWVVDRDTLIEGETWYSVLQTSTESTPAFSWRSGWHTNRTDGIWRFDNGGSSQEAELWIPLLNAEGDAVTTIPGTEYRLVGVSDDGRSRTFRRTTTWLPGVDVELPVPQVDLIRISETEGFVHLSDFVFSSEAGGPWSKTMQQEWNLLRFQPGTRR
ncbi:MAG: hypothetical protein JJ976_02730 [Rhodothermales bacterium]|nr:hypothetical protein [Rhodothermales bacterium]